MQNINGKSLKSISLYLLHLTLSASTYCHLQHTLTTAPTNIYLYLFCYRRTNRFRQSLMIYLAKELNEPYYVSPAPLYSSIKNRYHECDLSKNILRNNKNSFTIEKCSNISFDKFAVRTPPLGRELH